MMKMFSNLFNRSNIATASRKLRVENLEDRQLLSVNAGNAVVAEVALVAEQEVIEPVKIDLNDAAFNGCTKFEIQAIADVDALDTYSIHVLSVDNLGADVDQRFEFKTNDKINIVLKADTQEIAFNVDYTISNAFEFVDTLSVDFSGSNAKVFVTGTTIKGGAGTTAVNFEVNSINVLVPTVNVPANPYTKTLETLAKTLGPSNPTYLSIKASLDAAYANIVKYGTTVTPQSATSDAIKVNDGPTFLFKNANGVNLGGTANDDVFKFNSIANDYAIIGLDGTDEITFEDAARTVINMDLRTAQYVLPGQTGTLTLFDNIEVVRGSKFADVITGSVFGTTVFAGFGADTVRLTGGDSMVTVLGNNNNIVLTGFGTYTVNFGAIGSGLSSYNVVNAAALSPFAGATTVNGYGNNNTVVGGQNALNVDLAGDYITVSAAAAAPQSAVNVAIEGNYAKVITGFAADTVNVTGGFAFIQTGAGNDTITLKNSLTSRVYAGAGDDAVYLLGEYDSNNFIYGEDGNDILFGYACNEFTSNYYYCGNGNDGVIGGNGKDYIYGMNGNNVLCGSGGSDYIFGGAGSDWFVSGGLTDAPADPVSAMQIVAGWADIATRDATVQAHLPALTDGVQDTIVRGGGYGNVFFVTLGQDIFTPVPALADAVFNTETTT